MIAGADDQLRADLLLDVADEEAEEPNLYYEPLEDVSVPTQRLGNGWIVTGFAPGEGGLCTLLCVTYHNSLWSVWYISTMVACSTDECHQHSPA